MWEDRHSNAQQTFLMSLSLFIFEKSIGGLDRNFAVRVIAD